MKLTHTHTLHDNKKLQENTRTVNGHHRSRRINDPKINLKKKKKTREKWSKNEQDLHHRTSKLEHELTKKVKEDCEVRSQSSGFLPSFLPSFSP
jgi:hypothetical protein